MRKPAPRHMAPSPRPHRARAITTGLVAALVTGAGVYGLSQSTSASAQPVVAPYATAAPLVKLVDNPVVDELDDRAEVLDQLAERHEALVEDSRAIAKEAARIKAASTFYFPTKGHIGSPWGMRFHPILHRYKMHEGVDIGAPCGTPIRAVLAGTVTTVRASSGSGLHVEVDHGTVAGRQIVTDSLHMSRFAVSVGDKVERGQVIGYVGNTGLSTECHLHFALFVNNRNVDPAPFLNNS